MTMTSDISRRDFFVRGGILGAALTFPVLGRARTSFSMGPTLDSLRKALDARAVGKLRRIHCSLGACSPMTLKAEHAYWLSVFISLAGHDSVKKHDAIHSLACPGESQPGESYVSSLSFDSGLQVEVTTSTAPSHQDCITFRGEGGMMRLQAAQVAALLGNPGGESRLSGSLRAAPGVESLERTPLQHATLLVARLEQAEQHSLVSGKHDRNALSAFRSLPV